MHTIVISLKNSLDRRAKASLALDNCGYHWEFLDAVDGRLLTKTPPEYKPGKVKALLGHHLTPSELGCFLSHRAAWKYCVTRNEPILILEDDFLIRKQLNDVLHALERHSGQWELVRLQSLQESPQDTIHVWDGISFAFNKSDPLGSAAYVIAPQAAQVLLEKSRDIYEPVDHFLEHRAKHGVRILAAKPYPIEITGDISTITDRQERQPIKGLAKYIRSICRAADRLISNDPWFPKKFNS